MYKLAKSLKLVTLLKINKMSTEETDGAWSRRGTAVSPTTVDAIAGAFASLEVASKWGTKK